MWKNIKLKLFHKLVLAAQTLTATLNTASVDLKDLNSLAFLVQVGAMAFDGTNYLSLKLQHSDDDSTFVDVEEVYEGTAPIAQVLDAAGDANKSHIVEYRGGKRYVRLAIEETGTVSVPISVAAISLHPELMPPQ